jgi:hypothetical protein
MTRTATQKQQAIKAHIDQMRESEPGLSFKSAWRRVRNRQPELFDSDRPSTVTESHARNALRASVQRALQKKVEALRKEMPDADIKTIFAHLRAREPALMVQAAEAEGLPSRQSPIRITPHPVNDDDGDYIMLFAEDADQLQAQCDAGLWDSDDDDDVVTCEGGFSSPLW